MAEACIGLRAGCDMLEDCVCACAPMCSQLPLRCRRCRQDGDCRRSGGWEEWEEAVLQAQEETRGEGRPWRMRASCSGLGLRRPPVAPARAGSGRACVMPEACCRCRCAAASCCAPGQPRFSDNRHHTDCARSGPVPRRAHARAGRCAGMCNEPERAHRRHVRHAEPRTLALEGLLPEEAEAGTPPPHRLHQTAARAAQAQGRLVTSRAQRCSC